MATANSGAPLSSVPDDVLNRILVGVPLDDHCAATSACRAFRDVINGPRFLALRRKYGFAEYGVVVVDDTLNGVLKIRMAHQNGAKATISSFFHLVEGVSTTDGATRLFVCTWRSGPQILSLDASSRRWRHFATPPLNTCHRASSWTGSYLSSGPPGLTFGHHRVVVCWCTTPSATRGPRTQTVPFVVAPVTRTVWRTPAPTRAALSSSCATTRHSSEAPTAPGPRSRTESEKRTVVMLMQCPDPSSSARLAM